MTTHASWKALPLEDAELAELTVEGNGKHATVTVCTTDGRTVEFPASQGRVRVVAHAGVVVETTGAGDLALTVHVSGPGVVIRHARVQYPGTDDEWPDDLAAYQNPEPWSLGSWAVEAAEFELHRARGPA
jgi:hypothetical protein